MSFATASVGGFASEIARASSVAFSAYVLARSNPLVAPLEAAAARGARVHVVLDGLPIGAGAERDAEIAKVNAATVADLRAHGVDARLDDGSVVAQHLKAAVVDGRAYLDDRNWTATDALVTTADPVDVRCVAAAIDGRPSATADLATTKADAIAREASTIASGTGDRVDCASESFGATAVSVALARRAAKGDCVRLVVSARALDHASTYERRALARLVEAGVHVFAGKTTDKVCLAGTQAWIGSANATFSPPPTMLDWGLATSEPAIARSVAATLARDFSGAREIGLAELSG